MMGNDERSSTGSTVSEVFKTVLQSPAPICMFYFSHPFGVASPSMATVSKDTSETSMNPTDDYHNMASGCCDQIQRRRRRGRRRKQQCLMPLNKGCGANDGNISKDLQRERQSQHTKCRCNHSTRRTITNAMTSSHQDDPRKSCRRIPWPRDTWRNEFTLPPLIQFRGKQKDTGTAPDLEVILKTIRQAWNTPHSRSTLQSRSYEDTDTPATESIFNRNFGIKLKNNRQQNIKMGSGNNSTPVISGLLRRRYSVPEIIMRKHSLAQQKSFDESTAATAPSPHRSPAPGIYQKSYSTSTPTATTPTARSYAISSGSDSNLSRRGGGAEMSMRKSTLLRRIWNREMQRYSDARSGSWSPPMRRSQRRLHPEPIESHRCEECRKLDDSDDSDELIVQHGAAHKRLRLISNGNGPSDESTTHTTTASSTSIANCLRTTVSERVQTTTTSSLASMPQTNGKASNVHIYMTPIKSDDTSSTEPCDQAQDMLRVEIDLDNGETNDNSVQATISTDENRNENSESTIDAVAKTGTDTTLDRFISKLLIDNLTDLADEINEQFENNNNLMKNTSTPKSKRMSKSYLSSEEMNIAVSRCQTSEFTSTYSSVPEISEAANSRTEDSANGNEPVIYFPSCSLEYKDDMSSYTSNCSDLELNNIPNEDLVRVSAGSTYPQTEKAEFLVVPRVLSKLPRTESLEAQHSSASAIEEENGNETDDSVSLVDSLDDAQNFATNQENPTEQIVGESKTDEATPTCREAESFFVPIAGRSAQEVQSMTVAETMPEKLKEKIVQRQRELGKKRGEEHRKKQKQIEEIMDPKMAEENFYEKSPIRTKKDFPIREIKEKPPVPVKPDNLARKVQIKNTATMLRSEVGLLESYTIDSKGNMQFRAPQKTDTSTPATTAATRPKKPHRPVIHRKQSVVTPKPAELHFQPREKKSHSKSRAHLVKDVQKMTIFQAQSDIVTPDSANGPRRVYQKTEIQDGEKHIEILEIVECLETTPEYSPPDRSPVQSQTYRFSSKSTRHSKIPIPVYKQGRSSGYQKATRCQLFREASPNSVKYLSRNLHQCSGSTKVDRVIAELLIDALNRPDEIGIEIIRSPKDMQRSSGEKGSTRRQTSSQRRNTPRRSANSAKYQQVFEVIPEEKSSFSVDSSTDEATKSSTKNGSSSEATKSLVDRNSSRTPTTMEAAQSTIGAESPSDSTNQKLSNSGRRAVDHAEPTAWIGFFRRHNDSSIDEDDITPQTYPVSSVETSFQATITTPSTNTAAAGTTTPKDISSADCINSAESDNVLKLIEKTFQENKQENSVKSVPSRLDGAPQTSTVITTAGTTTTSATLTNTCDSCKRKEERIDAEINKKVELKQNIDLEKSSPNSSESSTSSSSTEVTLEPKDTSADADGPKKPTEVRPRKQSNKPGVWRVQSPDICKMAIPKSKARHKVIENCIMQAPSEFDCRSFIVMDDCNHTKSPLRHDCLTAKDSPTASTACLNSTTSSSTATFLVNKCTTCCYCNPDLHHFPRNFTTPPSANCRYCNRRRTPPKREEETNTEADYFHQPNSHEPISPPQIHPFYQSMTKSDHTHIRTKSRDSDVVSTKCTKVNEKIKNYISEGTGGQDTKSKLSTKNLSRPKNVNNLTKKDAYKQQGVVHKFAQDSLKSKDSKTKISSPDKKIFRLPASPYATNQSSSYEQTSSPGSSSDSTCPTTPSRRRPVLPPTRRPSYQGSHASPKKDINKDKQLDGKPTAVSRSNENIADNANNNDGNASSCPKVNGQNNGWSVTVAGSYNQDMAPDLEMRLSFPKPTGSRGQQLTGTPNAIESNERNLNRLINGNSMYNDNHYQDEDIANENFSRAITSEHHYQSHQQRKPTLTTPSAHLNPKRTLTRIVSERTHSQRDINFPEVNSNARNAIVQRQMARKAIKHTECRVAVTSATRTISNFSRGRQRTISYQAVNAQHHHLNPSQHQPGRTGNTTTTSNNRDRHVIRDNSLDLNNLSSADEYGDGYHRQGPGRHHQRQRRLSLESPTPSECLALSVMGNAISPEQKPRVLTMSEKDLTGRHQACFTRNRAFLN